MVVQKKFRKTPAQIVSYDYVDVVTGSGYQIYYLNRTHTSGATGWILTPNSLPADETNTWNLTTDGSQTFTTSEFNSPRILKGKIYFAGYNTSAEKIKNIILYKHDGTTQTQIGGSVETRSNPTNDYFVVEINLVASQAIIAKGEYLQLALDGDSGAEIHLGSTATFAGQLHLPFRILP